MNSIKVENKKIRKDVVDVLEFLSKKECEYFEKQKRFKNIAAKNIMKTYNKKCLFNFCHIDEIKAIQKLYGWNRGIFKYNYPKFIARMKKYEEKHKKYSDDISNIIKILTTIKLAESYGCDYIDLDENNCNLIFKYKDIKHKKQQ